MDLHVGDTVMHWSHGLGQITGIEERKLIGESQMYYAVKIQDIMVWVPADARLATRLRLPTTAPAFKKLLGILRGPAGDLPDERHERKSQLRAQMAGGTPASMCHVIRDLTALEERKSLNDDDKSTLRRARTMLLGEWEYALKIPLAQAEADLQQILNPPTV
jgi:RNA polymerase-interacting CarD/CdnL/TRCF family regulator